MQADTYVYIVHSELDGRLKSFVGHRWVITTKPTTESEATCKVRTGDHDKYDGRSVWGHVVSVGEYDKHNSTESVTICEEENQEKI